MARQILCKNPLANEILLVTSFKLLMLMLTRKQILRSSKISSMSTFDRASFQLNFILHCDYISFPF